MRIVTHFDPDVAPLIDVPQGKLVQPGSNVAVNREAPVITGDGVMDTQLENLRALICSQVWATYTLVTRMEKVRLWATTSRWGDGESKVLPASVAKKDDHPWIATLIQQAAALARVEENTCEVTTFVDGMAHTYVCNKLKLAQEQTRIDLLAKIQITIEKIDKASAASMARAQDLIKAFHAMALQFKMRGPRSAGPGRPDLATIAAAAYQKDP